MRAIARFVTFIALALAMPSLAAAATVIDTGPGTAAPNSAPITFQGSTFGQFTLTKKTIITGAEFFGTVAVPGKLTIAIYWGGPGSEDRYGFAYGFYERAVAATNGSAQWIGNLIPNLELAAGTYWIGAFGDGILEALHYGSAPNPLGKEAITTAVRPDYQRADNLDLAWRIYGTQVADPEVPAVPEPATWLFLMLGFGAVGAALRRRRAGMVRWVAA